MKTGKIPYQDINHTLRMLRKQVIDSLPYAEKNVPEFENPEQLFYWLKERTVYENDPPGVELLQTMQTLIRRGGRGDCDCFVIATLASCFVQDNKEFRKIRVVLAGREKVAPVHIYTKIGYKILDLTQPIFNSERNYKYTQELPVKI